MRACVCVYCVCSGHLLTAVSDLQLNGQTDPGRRLVSSDGGAPQWHQLDHAVVDRGVRNAHLGEVELSVVGHEEVRVQVGAQEVAWEKLHPAEGHRCDRREL